MRYALAFVAGVVLTFLVLETQRREVPVEVKSELKSLGAVEGKAYAEATTPDEKLRAAEALYGKMMVLFLANLGMELKKSEPIKEIPLPEEATAKETPLRETSPVVKSAPVCPPCARDQEEKKAAADKKLTPADKFEASPYIPKLNALLRNMRGVFVGKLNHFAGQRKGKADTALIEVNLSEQDGKLNGGIAVILTDEATQEPYSRNRGNGGNKTIRFNEKERIVYVEASPDSFFSFPAREFNGNEVTGDYYENKILVGKAILFRQ